MQHDFAITETRHVLIDCPLEFTLPRLLRGSACAFEFSRDKPLRIGVLPRFAGTAAEAVWVDAEPGYAFHVVNAWDDPADPDRVVLVLCRMDETLALGIAELAGSTPSSGAGRARLREVARLHRYVVDVRTAALVESTPLAPADALSDYPCVSPRGVGQRTRYAYAAAIAPKQGAGGGEPDTFDGVYKHDLSTGDVVAAHRFGADGLVGGDVVFVPRAARDAEDAGYVLCMCHAVAADRAELRVLDAADGLALLAKVHVPCRVPIGFHAAYVPGDELRW